MADAHPLFAYSTVATAPSPATSGTSLVVASGHGTRFGSTFPCNATVYQAGATAEQIASGGEIVRITARSTDTLTITRAQEGTSARTILVGDQIAVTVTPKSFTDLEAEVATAQTLVAVQAAQIAARQRANQGYWVGSGLDLGVSGTAGKLSLAAGMAVIGSTDLRVAASSAITGTNTAFDDITEMADATYPKWVLVEMTTTGTITYTGGTAAAAPVIPAFTASCIPLGLLYIPAGATNATTIDDALTTPNGNVKLVDLRERSGLPVTGWNYDTDTWVRVSAASFKVESKDVTARFTKGTRIALYDGTTTIYGAVASSAFSTDTTVNLISMTEYRIADATLSAPRFSYEVSPQGYPGWFTYLPTLSGWSVAANTAANPGDSILTSVSTTIATSLFNKTSHGLANGTAVTLAGVSTTTGVANNTIYYVVSANTNDFQLSATYGGSAITLGGTTDAALSVTTVGRYRWSCLGNICTVAMRHGASGTSTNTVHSILLPVQARNQTPSTLSYTNPMVSIDNNTIQAGSFIVANNGTSMSAHGILGSAASTASGVSRVAGGQVIYEF